MNGWRPTEINFDGVAISGRRFDWQEGHFLKTIEGIDDGAEVSYEDLRAGRFPGVQDTLGERDRPRSIIIRGFTYARTQAMLGELRTRLSAAMENETQSRSLSWFHLGQRRFTTVQPRSKRYPVRRSTGFMDFTLMLRANDQRIFGEEQPWSAWASSVELVHKGTYAAPTVIQVRGVRTGGYTISGPRGRRVVVSRAIATGDVHEFHSDEGILRVNGAAQETGVTRSDSIELPPGLQTVSVDNGLQCRVRFSPTFTP